MFFKLEEVSKFNYNSNTVNLECTKRTINSIVSQCDCSEGLKIKFQIPNVPVPSEGGLKLLLACGEWDSS